MTDPIEHERLATHHHLDTPDPAAAAWQQLRTERRKTTR